MDQPVVTFLSDYGLTDEFVGVCRGVIARRAPQAVVIDISHGIPRHDVRAGALVLRNSLPFMPSGVHLAVVDPNVGATGQTARRAVALRTGSGELLVGPDNGLLTLAADRLGGVAEAVDVGLSPLRLEPVSATFHGRDIFAPVAAALASGEALADAGDPFSPEELVHLELPVADRRGDVLVAHALTIDRFGNVTLNVDHHELSESGLRMGDALSVELGGVSREARYGQTFADVAPGELLVYEDSHRQMALAINRGAAATLLGVTRDAELMIRPA